MSSVPEEEEPLRVGVAIAEGAPSGARAMTSAADPAAIAMRARLEKFCEALGFVLDQPVEAYGIAHYHDLLEAMHEGRLDIAWLPPIIALRAAARGRTLPIAIPVRGGTSSFSSALFTRPGAPWKTPADLAGVRAAWVDRQSAAGYLVIRAMLRASGHDLSRVFASEAFLGSHQAVASAVLRGAADVGATYVTQDPSTGAILRAGWGAEPTQIIALAGPIPSDLIAASIRMPAPTIRATQRALCAGVHPALREAARQLLGAESFVPPSGEHLDPLSRLLEHLDDPPPPPKR